MGWEGGRKRDSTEFLYLVRLKRAGPYQRGNVCAMFNSTAAQKNREIFHFFFLILCCDDSTSGLFNVM